MDEFSARLGEASRTRVAHDTRGRGNLAAFRDDLKAAVACLPCRDRSSPTRLPVGGDDCAQAGELDLLVPGATPRSACDRDAGAEVAVVPEHYHHTDLLVAGSESVAGRQVPSLNLDTISIYLDSASLVARRRSNSTVRKTKFSNLVVAFQPSSL